MMVKSSCDYRIKIPIRSTSVPSTREHTVTTPFESCRLRTLELGQTLFSRSTKISSARRGAHVSVSTGVLASCNRGSQSGHQEPRRLHLGYCVVVGDAGSIHGRDGNPRRSATRVE